jgi:hypothetical protein
MPDDMMAGMRHAAWHGAPPGPPSARKVLAGYVRRYHGHRPHQGLHQEPLPRRPSLAVGITARIEHWRVAGGLISEYRKIA